MEQWQEKLEDEEWTALDKSRGRTEKTGYCQRPVHVLAWQNIGQRDKVRKENGFLRSACKTSGNPVFPRSIRQHSNPMIILKNKSGRH